MGELLKQYDGRGEKTQGNQYTGKSGKTNTSNTFTTQTEVAQSKVTQAILLIFKKRIRRTTSVSKLKKK